MDRSRRSGHGPFFAGSPGVFCSAGPECFAWVAQSVLLGLSDVFGLIFQV